MASKNFVNSDAKNKKWIKEGRETGQNQDYKPWITVRGLPSDFLVNSHDKQQPKFALQDKYAEALVDH